MDGFAEYNIRSAPEKVKLNFSDDNLSQWFLLTDGNERGIPWCGLVFRPMTGEISLEDNRWQTLDARDLLTLNYCTNADEYVKRKLLHYLVSRAQLICFDGKINSLEVIRSNIKSHFQFLNKCLDGFQLSFPRSRLRVTKDEIASIVVRRMKAIVNKASPDLENAFSLIEFSKLFIHSL